MNDDLHDIDKLFRDGINEHHEPPPAAVWEGVSQSLDQQQAALFKRKYYKLRRWLLLLLLLGTTSGGYFLIDKMKGNDPEKEIVRLNTSEAEKHQNPIGKISKSIQQETNGAATKENDEYKDESDKHKSNETIVIDKLITNKGIVQNEIIKHEDKVNHQRKLIITDAVYRNETTDSKPRVDKRELFARRHKEAVGLSKEGTMKNESTAVAQIGNNVSNQRTYASVELIKHHSPLIEPRVAIKDLTGIAIAKNSNDKKAKTSATHGISLNAFAAPNFSFDRMEDDDRLAGPGRNRRDFHRDEDDAVSFSAGLLLNYQVTKKAGLELGLLYTLSATNIGSKTVYAKADGNGHTRYELQCSSGYSYIESKSMSQPVVGDSATLSSGRTTLNYLTVPLAVNFSIEKGKFSLHPSVGFGANFLLSGKTQALLNANTEIETSTNAINGLKSTYLDGRIGIGAEYRLGRKLSIGVRPTARIALTPINQQTPVRSYQNYLSVEAGVRIKL